MAARAQAGWASGGWHSGLSVMWGTKDFKQARDAQGQINVSMWVGAGGDDVLRKRTVTAQQRDCARNHSTGEYARKWGGEGQRKSPSTLALASVQLKSEIWELTSVVPEWLSH